MDLNATHVKHKREEMKRLSNDISRLLTLMHNSGKSVNEIAKATGYSRQTVSMRIAQWRAGQSD